MLYKVAHENPNKKTTQAPEAKEKSMRAWLKEFKPISRKRGIITTH